MPYVSPRRRDAPGERHPKISALNPLDVEIIDLFVQISRALGQPRSLAEIYRLLFFSAHPLAMDELIDRLRLSRGSASQGLKCLRNLGAVRMVYVPADRRVHYEAVAELRNLLTRFLRDQIVPQLETGQARPQRIAGMRKQLLPEQRARLNGRVTMLQSWGKRGRKFLPLVVEGSRALDTQKGRRTDVGEVESGARATCGALEN